MIRFNAALAVAFSFVMLFSASVKGMEQIEARPLEMPAESEVSEPNLSANKYREYKQTNLNMKNALYKNTYSHIEIPSTKKYLERKTKTILANHDQQRSASFNSGIYWSLSALASGCIYGVAVKNESRSAIIPAGFWTCVTSSIFAVKRWSTYFSMPDRKLVGDAAIITEAMKNKIQKQKNDMCYYQQKLDLRK